MVSMTTHSVGSMKTCFKCGERQPRSNFYRHPYTADGLLGKCKECAKSDAKEHRLANLDRIRQYDRDRSKFPERARLAAIIVKRWRQDDRRRMAAHNAVARAIRKGAITKCPCIVCGSDKSMAHHESYDRPLDVIWYCQKHHLARHQQMKKEKRQP